jgi:hypothetical protein
MIITLGDPRRRYGNVRYTVVLPATTVVTSFLEPTKIDKFSKATEQPERLAAIRTIR